MELKNKQNMERISFVIPVYNNFKYTKHVYENLKLYYPDDEIVISDGGSTDETFEYFNNLNDTNLIFVSSNDKLNLCENYNRGVDNSTCDILVLLHNDMFIPPNFKQRLLVDLDENTIISYARIEPPVFPGEEPGKIVRDFGFDLDTLNKDKIIEFSETYNSAYTGGGYLFIACHKTNWLRMDEITFNPPQMWTADDDLHNRFQLANFKLIISNAIVYHFVSKTSRSDTTYREVEFNSNRNFIRKWGTRSKAPKYDIGLIIDNCNDQVLQALEPWSSTVYVADNDDALKKWYIMNEQKNTSFNLNDKIKSVDSEKNNEILVEVDGKNFSNNDYQYIITLPQIIQDSGSIGEFRLGNLKITIVQMNEYQNQLIHNEQAKTKKIS
jgi:glycosyltransferase involved in cell wall biosynthesis